MKDHFKLFLKLYKWAVVSLAVFIGSVLFIIAMVPYAWVIIGVVTGVVSVVLGVTSIYNGNAELLLLRKKAGPQSGINYRKGLRKLKRERMKLVRDQYSMQNYSTRNAYYLEIIEKEKEIAKHMGIDYVKPDHLPKDRYS